MGRNEAGRRAISEIEAKEVRSAQHCEKKARWQDNNTTNKAKQSNQTQLSKGELQDDTDKAGTSPSVLGRVRSKAHDIFALPKDVWAIFYWLARCGGA